LTCRLQTADTAATLQQSLRTERVREAEIDLQTRQQRCTSRCIVARAAQRVGGRQRLTCRLQTRLQRCSRSCNAEQKTDVNDLDIIARYTHTQRGKTSASLALCAWFVQRCCVGCNVTAAAEISVYSTLCVWLVQRCTERRNIVGLISICRLQVKSLLHLLSVQRCWLPCNGAFVFKSRISVFS